MNSETGTLTLDANAREEVMRALLIGLQSFGEIERLRDDFDILMAGKQISPELEQLKAIHPTGLADTVNLFAGALRWVHGF